MKRSQSALSHLSDEEARIRYISVVSLKKIFESYIELLNNKIINLDKEILKEKITYKKKILREELNNLYQERDEYLHKRNIMLTNIDILEPENEF
jgi:hypothetical protein